jgi:hypothetical protein
MGDRLQDLEHELAKARGRLEDLEATPGLVPGIDRKAADLREEIRRYEGLIAEHPDHKAAVAAAQKVSAEKAAKEANRRRGQRIVKGLGGCGVPAVIALVIVAAAVFFGMDFLGDDDEGDAKCSSPTQSLGGVRVQLVADCETDATPTTTTPTPSATGAATGKPDAADLAPGQVLYEGTTGGQLGCIACDGQSRFINIKKSTTALGDAERAGQEIVWPEIGEVVDFGIQIPRPNKGRYGINLFVNGGYSVGCAIETGSSSCRVLAGQDPSPLAAGDRVTIIVGEAGTVDKDGVPVEEGDFVLEWWFVFQPE